MKRIEFNNIIDEALRQWLDFEDDRKELTLIDFVQFSKEIAEQMEEDANICRESLWYEKEEANHEQET